MVSAIEENPIQTLGEFQESINLLIRYVYLSGFQDGKRLWYENEEVVNKVSEDRISKIISALSMN